MTVQTRKRTQELMSSPPGEVLEVIHRSTGAEPDEIDFELLGELAADCARRTSSEAWAEVAVAAYDRCHSTRATIARLHVVAQAIIAFGAGAHDSFRDPKHLSQEFQALANSPLDDMLRESATLRDQMRSTGRLDADGLSRAAHIRLTKNALAAIRPVAEAGLLGDHVLEWLAHWDELL